MQPGFMNSVDASFRPISPTCSRVWSRSSIDHLSSSCQTVPNGMPCVFSSKMYSAPTGLFWSVDQQSIRGLEMPKTSLTWYSRKSNNIFLTLNEELRIDIHPTMPHIFVETLLAYVFFCKVWQVKISSKRRYLYTRAIISHGFKNSECLHVICVLHASCSYVSVLMMTSSTSLDNEKPKRRVNPQFKRNSNVRLFQRATLKLSTRCCCEV